MSHPGFAVSENSLVLDTLGATARHHVHRVPMIDEDRRLVGIVSFSDAVLPRTSEPANVAEVPGGRRDGEPV